MYISNLFGSKAFQLSAVAVGSFAVGVGVGYAYKSRKKTEPEEDSIQLVLPYDNDRAVDDPEPVIFDRLPDRIVEMETIPVVFEDEVVEEATEDISEDGVSEEETANQDDTDESDISDEVNNVFTSSTDGWDWEEEVASREDGKPCLLHVDEFMRDELGWTQSTLTFYNGDRVLVDEQDVPWYDNTSIVDILKFGHGSNDPNVCYVRFPKHQSEFEVLLFEGFYTKEVLGYESEESLEKELRHSDLRRFRDTD